MDKQNFRATFKASSLAVAGALLATAQADAQSGLEISGQVDFGFRAYLEDGLFAGQSDAGAHFFMGGAIDASMSVGGGDVVLQFSALTDDKNGRSNLNLKKAYYTQTFDTWDLLVGYNVENWGVVESASVLNVLNPTNNTDVLFGREQRGTPMINANFTSQYGTLSAYALVGFEPPEMADRASRNRSIWATNGGRASYEEGNGRNLDFALRYSNNFSVGDGALDVSASYFNGTSRDPVGLPGCANIFGAITEAICNAVNAAVLAGFQSGIPASGGNSDAFWAFMQANATDPILNGISAIPAVGFVPYYQHIQQLGGSAVYARNDLQLRFEGALRKPKGEDASFSAVVGGDYTWNGLFKGDDSMTVAVEYLYDNRDTRQPLAIFENDVFLGVNYMLNDSRDTRLKAGGFYDLDSHAQLYQFSVSTRLNDSVRAELSAVHVKTDGYNDPLSFIGNDNFVEFKISTFF